MHNRASTLDRWVFALAFRSGRKGDGGGFMPDHGAVKLAERCGFAGCLRSFCWLSLAATCISLHTHCVRPLRERPSRCWSCARTANAAIGICHPIRARHLYALSSALSVEAARRDVCAAFARIAGESWSRGHAVLSQSWQITRHQQPGCSNPKGVQVPFECWALRYLPGGERSAGFVMRRRAYEWRRPDYNASVGVLILSCRSCPEVSSTSSARLLT